MNDFDVMLMSREQLIRECLRLGVYPKSDVSQASRSDLERRIILHRRQQARRFERRTIND